jgi:hypothetical protein
MTSQVGGRGHEALRVRRLGPVGHHQIGALRRPGQRLAGVVLDEGAEARPARGRGELVKGRPRGFQPVERFPLQVLEAASGAVSVFRPRYGGFPGLGRDAIDRGVEHPGEHHRQLGPGG